MTRLPVPGPAARQHGPYETERDAAYAARALGGPLRDGWSILSAEQNRQLLTQACDSAGITLGAYDERIMTWLAGFEDSTCAVIAGVITRAHQSAKLTRRQLATVLDALDVAAEYKRDRAATCPDCDADPSDLCTTCAWRLQLADEYDALAARLGHASEETTR